MFRKIQNIDTSFRQFRLFSFCIMAATSLICIYTVYTSFKMVSSMQSRIYVLANGKALEAYSSDRKDNIPVEAKDHIRTFHQFFFTLDPDEQAIKSTITKALYLADESAKKVYDNLQENKFYSGLISGNVNQTIKVDSVQVDVNQYPYKFRCYATQDIIRPTTISKRSLITEGELRSVSRTENNSHGFLIERWNTIENRDIKTVNRN